jgi:cullin-associated NEDD8-dissociated protein 1
MAPPSVSIRELSALLPKLEDPDSDIRFMSLVDLHKYLDNAPHGFLNKEYQAISAIVEKLLKCLDDSNGDVQSQALKTIGPLAIRTPQEMLSTFIDKVTNVDISKSQDHSIPSTASRYLVIALPRPVAGLPPSKPVEDAYFAISRVMIPRLLGYIVIQPETKGPKALPAPPPGMLRIDVKNGVDVDAIDLLNEVVRCFGTMLKPEENEALLKRLWEILEDRATGVIGKKKAIAGISILSVYLSDESLSGLVSTTIESLRASHLAAGQRRLLIAMLGSLARTIPSRFGVYLKQIAEFVLQALSQEEHDELLEGRDEDGEVDVQSEEVREAALVTLEDFLTSCVNDMRLFTDEALTATLRYLAYDPAIVNDSDDEMDDTRGDAEDDDEGNDFDVDDEDFEEEEALDDNDDSSWKIRRCAAKALQALIRTRLNDLMESGVLYDKIAPFLVKRLGEREENVRLEVLSSLAFIVRKTADNAPVDVATSSEEVIVETNRSMNSKKRPRGRSDGSMFDGPDLGETYSPGHTPSPVSGPRAEIGSLGPSIVKGIQSVFNQKSVSTKQAAIVLLREYANMKHGGLNDHLGQVIEPVVNAIKSTAGLGGGQAVVSVGTAAATGNSLRMESLDFLLTICETHSSKTIAPYLDSMISGTIAAINDKYFKVSCAAIGAAEGIIKVLTPPRSLGSDKASSKHLKGIYGAILAKVRANDADLEVRQRAIHALGVCLVRTSGEAGLMSSTDRSEALKTLEERLANETTRIISVEAIDSIAATASKGDLSAPWIRSVSEELSHQLRKADIRLRAASLGALKRFAANDYTIEQYDDETIRSLTTLLLPLLNVDNLGTLHLALDILTNLVNKSASKVVTPELTNALCIVVTSTLSGPTLTAFLDLVSAIGQQGQGQALMKDLLSKASLNGDATIVGAAIGALLASGGSSVGVGLQDILAELKNAADDQRRCLALCILGEVSLRQGSSSSIRPQTFLEYFGSKSDQVRRIAAISFGRAGAGDFDTYLPVIIDSLQTAKQQSLLLHSVREILTHASKSAVNEASAIDIIWEKIISLSDSEDNRAIGAECVGRLVGLDPKKLLPALQVRTCASRSGKGPHNY